MAHYSTISLVPIEKIRPHKSIQSKQADIPVRYLAECKSAGAIIEPSICTVDQDPNKFTLMSHPWAWHAAQLLMYPTIPVIALSADHGSYKPLISLDGDSDIVSWAEELYGVMRRQGISVTKLASRLGMNRSTLSHTLQLRKLHRKCVDALRRESIKKGHAKRLAYLEEDRQVEALDWLVNQPTVPTVHEFEQHLKSSIAESVGVKSSCAGSTPATPNKDPDTVKFEQRISEHFGSKAQLSNGRLIIDYYSDLDILQGILEKSNFE